MTASYKKISDTKTKSILKQIDAIDPNHGLEPLHVKMMVQDLPFTNTWQKIICEDYSTVPNRFQTYLINGKDLYSTQYSPDPYHDNYIHQMDLTLNNQNIIAYLFFYYEFFLSGSDTLKPILHASDIRFQEAIPPITLQSIEKDFSHYPEITETNDGFRVIIPTIFKQSIMIITFSIQNDGIVKIEDRQCLIDDLLIKSFP